MPDISMCPGGDCVDKQGCLRYRAKPEARWQSWSAFDTEPRLKRGDKTECKWHIAIKNWPENMIKEIK